MHRDSRENLFDVDSRDSRENLFDMERDSREKLSEILAVVTILRL
jgi:hypothetical protein